MGPWGDLGGSGWIWGPGRAGRPCQNKTSFPELRLEIGIVEATEVVVRVKNRGAGVIPGNQLLEQADNEPKEAAGTEAGAGEIMELRSL